MKTDFSKLTPAQRAFLEGGDTTAYREAQAERRMRFAREVVGPAWDEFHFQCLSGGKPDYEAIYDKYHAQFMLNSPQ